MFDKNSNFQNFEFSLTFSTIFFSDKNRKFLIPKHFRPKVFGFFFDEKFSDQKISAHIFRSQMIPRFRKSHLEQRATIIKTQTRRTKKNLDFSSIIAILGVPISWILCLGTSESGLLSLASVKARVRAFCWSQSRIALRD